MVNNWISRYESKLHDKMLFYRPTVYSDKFNVAGKWSCPEAYFFTHGETK
jgi:hypothetical protein